LFQELPFNGDGRLIARSPHAFVRPGETTTSEVSRAPEEGRQRIEFSSSLTGFQLTGVVTTSWSTAPEDGSSAPQQETIAAIPFGSWLVIANGTTADSQNRFIFFNPVTIGPDGEPIELATPR
jgi:hypothetical protein